MYRLQALSLFLCTLIVGTLQAQQPYGTPTYKNTQVWDTYTANAAQIGAASLTWTHYEALGYTAGSLQFSFQITGTPSTLSAKVQPCMRSPTDQPTGGICPIAEAVTSTSTSSFVLNMTGPWDYYVVTVTWTGGGITALTNKVTGIGGQAKNSGSGTITPSTGAGPNVYGNTTAGSSTIAPLTAAQIRSATCSGTPSQYYYCDGGTGAWAAIASAPAVSSAVAITGGTIAGTPISGSTGSFTTLANSGQATSTAASAASAPARLDTGTLFTGGSGTTTTPHWYINQGTAPTTWNTAGTHFGINAVSGFAGNFLDFHVNGGASVFKLDNSGNITMSGGLVSNFRLQSSSNVVTSGTPTVSAGQVGFGATTAANTSCGTITLSTGCLAINIGGTTRYIPYF